MKNLLLLLFLLSTFFLSAQPSFNMNLLGTWDDTSLPGGNRTYSDVWGYAAPDGREYALLGSREFLHVLDVTNPANITEISRLNTFSNSAASWRDVKVYDEYAYFVVDVNTTEGLQVVDLSNLPTSAGIVFQDATEFGKCHNTFIDTTASPVRLYLFGTSGGSASNELMVYSLADPAAPTLLASLNLSSIGYIHDGYARNDTLYANAGNPGMYAYDLRDLSAPDEIGTLANYAQSGYNHSSWDTPDGKHVVMCDEVPHGLAVKMVSLDKSDPFAMNMEVETTFRSNLDGRSSNFSTPHNPYVLNDSLLVLSYYGDGVQVWNIADRSNPRQLAYYDTTPTGTTGFIGIWGAYPWLPSGNILASDMVSGLYVVEVDNFNALPVTYQEWTATAEGKNAFLQWTTTEETDNAGWTVEHAGADGQFTSLGFVTAGRGDYQFTHQLPGAGEHLYRLRQQDYDGTETFSDIRSLTFGGTDSETLLLSPNPAPAAAPVQINGLEENDRWELLDLSGHKLRTGNGNRLIADLPRGVYLLKAGKKTVRLLVR